MARAWKGRISVTRIAAAYRVQPMWVEMSDGHRQLSPAATAALDGFTDTEARVLSVLTAHRIFVDGGPGALLGVLRCFGRSPRDATRARRQRRERSRMSDADRQAFSAMRDQVDRMTGRTKPTDPLSALCSDLTKQAGLTPSEIVRVLDATGLEPMGVDREAARQRVEKRVRRQDARAPA
jgi:hypothetical protein